MTNNKLNEWFIPDYWQNDDGQFWYDGRWYWPWERPDPEPKNELDPNYELPLDQRQPTHGPKPVKHTESWLPNTNKSILKDVWTENLRKSTQEKQLVELVTKAQAPPLRPPPNDTLWFDHNREAKENLFHRINDIIKLIQIQMLAP